MKFCNNWLNGVLRRCLKLSYYESPASELKNDLDLLYSQIFMTSLRQGHQFIDSEKILRFLLSTGMATMLQIFWVKILKTFHESLCISSFP